MRRRYLGIDTVGIGMPTERHSKMIIVRTRICDTRVLDLQPAEILPRIR